MHAVSFLSRMELSLILCLGSYFHTFATPALAAERPQTKSLRPDWSLDGTQLAKLSDFDKRLPFLLHYDSKTPRYYLGNETSFPYLGETIAVLLDKPQLAVFPDKQGPVRILPFTSVILHPKFS